MTKQEQKDKAYEEYLAIQEPASKEYLAIDEPAWKEYEAIIEPAWKEYLVKCEAIDEDIKIIDGKRYRLID